MGFKDILLAFLPDIVKGILGIVIPAIIAYLGITQHWKWPLAILLFFIASGIGLYIYTNIPVEWFIKSGEIEGTLKKWSDDGGYSIKSSIQSDDRFHFIITDKEGYHFDVFNQKSNKVSEITIGTGINLTKRQQEILHEMPQKGRNIFYSNLNIELLKMNVGIDTGKSQPDRIIISKDFYYRKGLTKYEFIENIHTVERAFYIARQIMIMNGLVKVDED